MAVAFTRSETPGTEEATLFYGNERDADTLSIKEDGIRPTEDRRRALFAWESRSLVRRRILQVIIGVLGVAIIAFIILAFKLSVPEMKYTYLGKARFKPDEKHIEFKNAANIFVLSAKIGLNVSSHLMERRTKSDRRSKYITSDGVTLVLNQETDFSLAVNWTSSLKDPIVFMDCFSLSNAHWYGGSEFLGQKWPLEKMRVSMGQYVPQTTSGSQLTSTFGSVLERYWLSSRGIAILVDAAVPLHVSINENDSGKLCIKSDTTGYLHPVTSYLGYRILSGFNSRDLHLEVVDKFLGKPSNTPDEHLIRKPLWIIENNSDIVFKTDIQSFWENMTSHNLSCGNIVINELYHWLAGDNNIDQEWLNLDTNSVVPLTQVNSIGCNVSLSFQPYLQINSKMFSEAAKKGYLLKNCGGRVPGLINWRSSLAACIDVTHNSSTAWLEMQLFRYRQTFGFDSFAFRGGGVTHLPWCYQFFSKATDPGHYATDYAKFASRTKGLNVQVGYQTQNLPIFVTMRSKISSWDGLRAVIPTVLTYGIMGYPYVLPSVIGGQSGSIDKELYIRWMQVSMFLPGIQFYKPPWDFDAETIKIVRDLLAKRSQLSSVIVDAFKNVSKTGAPVIRPLWWIVPNDSEALKIDDQFLVGDTYLVAPILEKIEVTTSVNASHDNVKALYLPQGNWQVQFEEPVFGDSPRPVNGVFYNKAGQWVRFRVTLNSLLFFKAIS